MKALQEGNFVSDDPSDDVSRGIVTLRMDTVGAKSSETSSFEATLSSIFKNSVSVPVSPVDLPLCEVRMKLYQLQMLTNFMLFFHYPHILVSEKR